MPMIFNEKVVKINFHSHTVWNWNRIIAVHTVWVVAWIPGTFKGIVYHYATIYQRKSFFVVLYSSLKQAINSVLMTGPGGAQFPRKR